MAKAAKFVYNSQFLTYIIAGGLTYILDFSVFNTLILLQVNYIAAEVIKTPVIITFNYFAHRVFTFKSKSKKLSELSKYIINVGFLFIYSVTLLFVLVDIFGINELYAKLLQLATIPVI